MVRRRNFDILNDVDISQTATVSSSLGAVWEAGYRKRNYFDVTGIVQSMFSTGTNYGFALHATDRIRAFSSENNDYRK